MMHAGALLDFPTGDLIAEQGVSPLAYVSTVESTRGGVSSPSTNGSGTSSFGTLPFPLTTAEFQHPISNSEVGDQAMGLPFLDSNPGAPVTLHLDFTGNFETSWFNSKGDFPRNGSKVETPSFSTDSNHTSFSASEQALIKEIWARVAEDFAPFNINVTTHYYGTYADGKALKVAIGGHDSDWYREWMTDFNETSGTSNFKSFTTSAASNVVFVFSDNIFSWSLSGKIDGDGRSINFAAATATTASHEAGHAFGLTHNSIYLSNYDGKTLDSNGNLVGKIEYDPGTPLWSPIMGNSLISDRTTWANAPAHGGPHVLQDDMAILAGLFGYRADDHGDTLATASAMTAPSHSLQPWTGKGIIGKSNDHDWFRFTSSGGQIEVRVNPDQYGANLIPVAELWSDKGFVAKATSGGLNSSNIKANVAAGTYYVKVKGFGDYGDVGQFTVTVSHQPVIMQSGSVTSVTSGTLTKKTTLISGTTATYTASTNGAGPSESATRPRIDTASAMSALKSVKPQPAALKVDWSLRALDAAFAEFGLAPRMGRGF